MDDVLKEKEYCVRNEKQDFLVSATVYKARHLQVLNCDTFIMVSCDAIDFFLHAMQTKKFKEYDIASAFFKANLFIAQNMLFVPKDNLPTFGPTWLHLYSGIQESHYVGKLLVSFSSEALPIQSVPAHKSQAVRIYEPLLLSNYWEERVFVIKFCIINMQLFAEMSTSQLLVYLSCADICSKAINLNIEKQKPTSRYWFANCAESVLTVKIQLPDYRHKYFVKATITNLCDKLLDFTNLLKRVIIGQGEQNFNLHKHNIFTRLLAQLELSFMQAYDKITEGIYKQHTKLDQLRKSYILQQLEQNQYPNILLHVIRSGHSSVIAVARFNMVHYFHQANSLGVTGIQYGKRRTILLRSIHCNHSCPDRCGCIHAKLDYQLQIETERKEQVAPYALIAPEDPLCSDSDGRQELLKNCLTTKYVNCKIHVYQGRIFGGFDDSKQCNTLPCTLPSSWNETVDFKNIPFAISTVACRKMNQECIVMFILQDDKQLTICSSSENSGNVEMLLAHGLPPEIVPSLVPFIIKVLFVGLRQMHKRSYQNIKKSRILISIGDGYIMSGDSGTTHGNSANFPEGYETCSVHLPVNPNYWPLMTIKHIDFTNERQMKIIGKSIVNASKLLDSSITKSTPENATIIDIIDQEENETCISNESNTLLKWPNFRYMIEEQVKHFVELKTCAKRLIADNVDHTWWTKFYDGQLSKIHHKYALKIYDTELEKVSDFNGFQDWSGSYTLHKIRDKKKGGKQEYGIVKSLIQIHSNPKASSKQILSVEKPLIPSIVEIVVVVYVVQALNLTSRDIMSQSDAYIKLSYGRQCFRDRAYYIPNQASPVFGRRFEMRGILPRDFVSSDDLIGSTSIDIEDRFRSKHLPSFGIPNYYKSKGCNKWRHQMKPSEMLQKICENHGLQNPRITGRKIIIGKAEFEAEILEVNECLTEQLCLIALNNFKHVVNGLSLTPEHVETRSLYHPKRGGIEQGKVQVWIELYEPNRPHPLPLDITPQPPKPYELRVIVWNTADVMLNERNIFGTEMSDIYVKCWLQEFTEAQYTDVHYRSLTGEGNFNWRMVFSFRYSPADGMLVLRRRKAFYEQYDTELKYPPVLTVQIWDNDSFSADDFLGTVDLNLTQLPVPASTAEACTLPQSLSTLGSGSGTDGNGTLNLFGCRRIKGWFPVHGNRASNIDTSDRQRWHDGISLTTSGNIIQLVTATSKNIQQAVVAACTKILHLDRNRSFNVFDCLRIGDKCAHSRYGAIT
uniref:C2 domain-containing protein n=1 Tax=Anopheles christyi TaxID=43041 RepID=A0A182JZK0_9DIPT